MNTDPNIYKLVEEHNGIKRFLVNPSIYQLAGEFADRVRAHAIIESGEVAITVGDGGQAWGLLQMHPGFVKDYAPFTNIGVHDPWPEAEVKMAATYYRQHRNIQLDLLVQGYNLGLYGVMSEGQRNPKYLADWYAALKRIQKT